NCRSADYFLRRQRQHAQQIVIHVEEDAIHGKNGAPNRALAENRGEPFFRLFQRNLALLALGDIDRGAFDEFFTVSVGHNDGALQYPENGSILPALRTLIVQDLALLAQIVQKLLSVRRLGIEEYGQLGK